MIFWIGVFVASLIVIVKGADWLLKSAEKIGLAAGLSPFVIGVTIVGLGTSFPELVSSLIAMLEGATEIVTANAVGSNIANIFLVVGLSAVVSKKLSVTKSLINIDLPLLAMSTVLFLGVAWDREITLVESILLLVGYFTYFLYTIFHKDDESDEDTRSRKVRKPTHVGKKNKKVARPKLVTMDFILLIVGIIGLVIGAKYLIDSVINLSQILGIGTGVIAITAVAFGTSLPELLVSIKAALNKKSEIALGNIFGSNVFNILVVTGIPGLIGTLYIDEKTFLIGIPTLIAATFLFIISGISRKIYKWEGIFFILLYVLFMGKLFNLF